MRAGWWIGMACAALLACDDGELPHDSSDGSVGREPESGMRERDAASHAEPMRVLAPADGYAGKSLEEWAIEYIHWSYSQTTCESAASDRDGSGCGLYQDSASPVFFLERSDYGDSRATMTTRTECIVPAGKAILVPIAVTVVDNTEVETPRSVSELEQLTLDVQDSTRSMLLEADGVAITDLRERGVGPTRMAYPLPPPPNYFSCQEVDGLGDTTIEPAFITGFLALFEPPAPGRHVVEYASLFTNRYRDYAFHIKAHIAVEEAND